MTSVENLKAAVRAREAARSEEQRNSRYYGNEYNPSLTADLEKVRRAEEAVEATLRAVLAAVEAEVEAE